MKATIEFQGRTYFFDFTKPIDLSIPLRAGAENVNAWYCDPVRIEPVVMGDWIGDVKQGGSVNFRNVFLNPHGNGTHTECVGHISKENYSLNTCLKQFFFLAEVVTVLPENIGEDQVITKQQLENSCKHPEVEAIIIRTLPNSIDKNTKQYSNTNPAYIDPDAIHWLVERGINHLLIDLPSIDRENDNGQLKAHHAFWKYPEATRTHATISEMIYVNDEVKDGLFLLNLQITALENDASPSKPILFEIGH